VLVMVSGYSRMIAAVMIPSPAVPTAVITAARLMVSLGGRRRAGLFLVQCEQLGGNAGLDHQFHAPAGGVPLGAVGVVDGASR
jgi:hypothetical protein